MGVAEPRAPPGDAAVELEAEADGVLDGEAVADGLTESTGLGRGAGPLHPDNAMPPASTTLATSPADPLSDIYPPRRCRPDPVPRRVFPPNLGPFGDPG